MNEQDVDVGVLVKLALIIIILACVSMCANSIRISEDVRTIKEHMVKTE